MACLREERCSPHRWAQLRSEWHAWSDRCGPGMEPTSYQTTSSLVLRHLMEAKNSLKCPQLVFISNLSMLVKYTEFPVLCDESGHTIFPFSYLAHMTLPTPAQGRLRICSPLLRPSTMFGTLRRSMLNCFNSSRVGPELVPYMKMAKIGSHFENEQPRLYSR